MSISGALLQGGNRVALCSGTARSLPGVAKVRDPEKYFPALERLNHTTIAVSCTGSTEAADAIDPATPLTFEYAADMTLTGERTTAAHQLSGSAETMLNRSIGG